MIELDGHVVPATQREFLAALGGSTVEEAAAAVGARGERVVLILDTFELLAMLDHWLCRVMLPALPSNVRVVIGGRNAPFERWRSYGPLLCSVPLGNLAPEEADALLRRNGVDGETAGEDQRRRPRPPAEPPARRRGRCATARGWRSRRSPPARSARSWRASTSTGSTRRRGAR